MRKAGLARCGRGGCYPWNAEEIADYPFRHSDLAPHYAEVARRVGITGADDDLARFMPLHDHLLPPLRLDLGTPSVCWRHTRVSVIA